MRSVKFYDAGNWKPTISPFEKVSDAKKLVEAKGHDFELLWQNNDMQKLTQILPDVPWKELRNGYNAACEKARISVDQDFMQEYNEIMRLANDEKMMNKAEELRQRNAYTTVPPMRLGSLLISQAELLIEAKHSFDIAKAIKFPAGKPKGSTSSLTQYIHNLATDNPNKTVKELLQLEGVREKIGGMVDGTFANHVTKARNPKS